MRFFASLFAAFIANVLLGGVVAGGSGHRCTNPSVRKEWRTLSVKEKTDWVDAVKCLSRLPRSGMLSPTVFPDDIPPVNTSSSYYDDFVYVHMDLNIKIHFTGLFFPFHRYYVWSYEQVLKEKCGFTGASPYWNWAQDAPDFGNATIWQESSHKYGLGGFGNGSIDWTVTDGAFSDFEVAYPAPHILRRQFTPQPYLNLSGVPFFQDPALYAATTFTQDAVDTMVNGFVGDFKGMQKYMESFEGPHGSVHLIVGGDLAGQCPADADSSCTPGPTWSANEPLFWMHHAMVDKVWYDWQHKNPANFWSYEGGSVEALNTLENYTAYPNGFPPALHLDSTIPSDGMFEQTIIRNVMDTTGGVLCYVYDS